MQVVTVCWIPSSDHVTEASGAGQEPLAGGTRASCHLPVLYSSYNIPLMAIDSS